MEDIQGIVLYLVGLVGLGIVAEILRACIFGLAAAIVGRHLVRYYADRS